MAQGIGWRWIFFASAALSLIGMLMVRGTPESRASTRKEEGFDYAGVATFMVMMVALQEKPGTYCFIGNGDTPMVHHPQFVLNKEILPRGAAYWVALTEGLLQ